MILRMGTAGQNEGTHRECPVYHTQELSLEHVKLADRYAADPRVEAVRTECIAQRFAGDRDSGDDESMTGEGRERE